MTILYRFARPSDPSLHRDDLVRTLRVVPLAQSGGVVVAFNDTQKDYKLPDPEPVHQRWRLVVVGVDAALGAASVRVLLEGDLSFLIDAAPVYDDTTDTARCVLLGRTLEPDPASHTLRTRYWLRPADATSITDPVFFLERSWRNFADTIYPRGPGPGTGVRYEPLALGGLTASGAQFLVLAERTLASGPDDTEVAVVALIASVDSLHVTREIVIARRTYRLAVATWPTQVRCWPVTNLQPTAWDVGIQDGAQVAIDTVTPYDSEHVGAPRFAPVLARPGWAVDDFALAGGGVAITQMMTFRAPLVAFSRSVVLLERNLGTGIHELASVAYSPFVPSRRVRLGRTRGDVRLTFDEGTGSHWPMLHRTPASGETRLCKIGGSMSVFQRVVLPLPDPSLLSYTAGGNLLGDHAVAYDPSGDRTLCAGTTLDPEGTTVGSAIAILPVNRGRPAAIRWRSDHCATIGLEYYPWAPPARRPSRLIGHGPLAGQGFFELSLEHGPPRQTVSLVISPELVDDAEDPCTPVILRPADGFSLLSTVTDGAGAAAMRVPLDEIALPELFRTDTAAWRRAGEILVFPRPLYAQWQWTVLTGDFGLSTNGVSDFVHDLRRSPRTITQTSDVMVLVVDV